MVTASESQTKSVAGDRGVSVRKRQVRLTRTALDGVLACDRMRYQVSSGVNDQGSAGMERALSERSGTGASS